LCAGSPSPLRQTYFRNRQNNNNNNKSLPPKKIAKITTQKIAIIAYNLKGCLRFCTFIFLTIANMANTPMDYRHLRKNKK
jgi:hypothetical protein